MNVEVRMPYDGDMTMDCSGSDFEISAITAYDSDSTELTDSDASASTLTIHDLTHGGDYTFIIEGAGYVSSGTYDCSIECSSDAPTEEPTVSPSFEPSSSPTADPSSSPTTPAPSHPGELICGDHVNGTYNGDAMNVEVRMPYDGDMTMDLSGSSFEIGSITAYDSADVELTDVDSTASILTVRDLTHSSDYSFVIEGASYVSSGTVDIKITCSSDAPTKSPTTNPSDAPTKSPTTNPTVQPTRPLYVVTPEPTPTVSPTMNPTDAPTTSQNPYPVTTTTTTTVEMEGCCAGDAERTTTRCNAVDTERGCTRRSACHWVETSYASDCEWKDTEEPTDPGCCIAVDQSYQDNCSELYTEDDCAGRNDQCYWTPTGDSYDCSQLWSQPAAGCCKSGSGRVNQRCESLTMESECDQRSNCFWVESADECDADDDYDGGCCAGNSERASIRCNKKDSATTCDR